MYACLYVYICMYVCMYVCICMYVRMDIHLCTCMYTSRGGVSVAGLSDYTSFEKHHILKFRSEQRFKKSDTQEAIVQAKIQ